MYNAVVDHKGGTLIRTGFTTPEAAEAEALAIALYEVGMPYNVRVENETGKTIRHVA